MENLTENIWTYTEPPFENLCNEMSSNNYKKVDHVESFVRGIISPFHRQVKVQFPFAMIILNFSTKRYSMIIFRCFVAGL